MRHVHTDVQPSWFHFPVPLSNDADSGDLFSRMQRHGVPRNDMQYEDAAAADLDSVSEEEDGVEIGRNDETAAKHGGAAVAVLHRQERARLLSQLDSSVRDEAVCAVDGHLLGNDGRRMQAAEAYAGLAVQACPKGSGMPDDSPEETIIDTNVACM